MLSKNAQYLLSERYCRQGEEPADVFKRTAMWIAQGDTKAEERFFDLMVSGTFLPNSPCMFNSPAGSLHACYTLGINDDLGSIFSTVANMARIFKSGGGVGINFSPLRQEGGGLSGGGTSSGVLSFMNIFDNVVDTVKQGGKRRGALMGIMNYTHPDIYKFIKVKLEKKLQNFNLSIMVDNDFMKKVQTGGKVSLRHSTTGIVQKVNAKDIFELACFASWCNGDPAFLFYDRINFDNPYYPELPIDTVNPCSEVALPHESACCLGSINLSKFVWRDSFNFERFGNVVLDACKFLDSMNKVSVYPMEQIAENMRKYAPIGVGIMGFADCLIKLGIKYDSQECLDFIRDVGVVWRDISGTWDADVPHFYRRIIAPTGSLSILADCSSGIEPIYDVAFERSLTVGKIEEVRELYKSEYARTALQVSPDWHIKVLSKWQEFADGGISKTVNLPYEASVDDVKRVYLQAWESGCKGVTVYRDGSRDQVLTSIPYVGKCNDSTCTL